MRSAFKLLWSVRKIIGGIIDINTPAITASAVTINIYDIIVFHLAFEYSIFANQEKSSIKLFELSFAFQ